MFNSLNKGLLLCVRSFLPLLLQLRLLALLLAVKPLTPFQKPATQWLLTLLQSLKTQLLLLKKVRKLLAKPLKALLTLLLTLLVKLLTRLAKLLATLQTQSPKLLKMQLLKQKQWSKASNSLSFGFKLELEKAVPGSGAAFFFG